MRFKRITDNHYVRVLSFPRGPYDTQKKKADRRHLKQAYFLAFMYGFIITSIILGGMKAHAQPPAVIYTSGIEGDKAPGQVAAGRLTLRYEIENYIRQKFGKDGELAIRVARCESGMDPESFKMNGGKSLDRGLFMINSKFHPEVTTNCAFDARCSTDATYRIFVKQGYSFSPAWDWSKHCWDT